MTDKAREIFDMLGVEPDEDFKINDSNFKYSFSHNLSLECYDGSEWHEVENVTTYRKILNGEFKITKIPKPTKEDEIVLAYAKLCGCKWIARDEDGKLYAFDEKPDKWDDEWMADGGDKQVEIPVNISVLSFISWEDEEPYYIGE